MVLGQFERFSDLQNTKWIRVIRIRSTRATWCILDERQERPDHMSANPSNPLSGDLIEKIRKYQEANPELKKSHHFVFDAPLHPDYKGSPEYVWLGVNPGSDDEDWNRPSSSNTEETRDCDFQLINGRSKASNKRMNKLRKFLGHDRFQKTTHCELFFWGSSDTKRASDRYGYSFENNPHWDFCTRMNLALIQKIRPKAVFAERRNLLELYRDKLGLEFVTTHYSDELAPLIAEYRFKEGYPFYCFDHLSAVGKAIPRRELVKQRLIELLGES